MVLGSVQFPKMRLTWLDRTHICRSIENMMPIPLEHSVFIYLSEAEELFPTRDAPISIKQSQSLGDKILA